MCSKFGRNVELQTSEARTRCKSVLANVQNDPMHILEGERSSHQHEHHISCSDQLQMLTAHLNIPDDHHQNETTDFRTQQSRGKVRIISGKGVKMRNCV